MSIAIRSILPGMAFLLAGCGGSGGSGVASMPPPPPPVASQAVAIIPAGDTSQQFSAFGASHLRTADDQPTAPLLAADEQLQVRYVAASNSYEVQLPHNQDWVAIARIPTGPGSPINVGSDSVHLWLRSEGFQYSRLFEWSDADSIYGEEAIGMATPASGVPVTGSASYSGQILGNTSERHGSDDMGIDGTIALNFNFGSGSLAGSISPNLRREFGSFSLGTIDFRDTVYATGSTTFSGEFDTNLSGVNSFSGQFTGPNAQELIGNFALPYHSPIDSRTYQADGAFVGRK